MTRTDSSPTPAPTYGKPMPAQRSMKREARTAAENGEAAAPADDRAIATPRRPRRPGDAAIGETDNHGSSPYSQRGLPEKPVRDEQ